MKKSYLNIVFVLAILCTMAQANVISKIRDDRSPGYKFEKGYGSKASEQGKENGVGLSKKFQDIVSEMKDNKVKNNKSNKSGNKESKFDFDVKDKKFVASLCDDDDDKNGRNNKDNNKKKDKHNWKDGRNGKDNGCASVPLPGAVLLAFLGLAAIGWKKH